MLYLSTIRICIIWQKSFTPDALPAAALTIYSGLGPASRHTEMCLRWLRIARNIGGGCKLFYNGADGRKNGIGIVVREELAKSILEVKRVSDRLMAMKLEVKGSILNIVSACAPQVNNSMEEKNDFWEDLGGLIESASKEERIVLGADLNGHVGEGNIGDEEIMGRYGAGTRNEEGSMIVDFGKRMDLAIVNTYFKTKMNTG